jgi:uncharacterized protein YbaP (TraB family)
MNYWKKHPRRALLLLLIALFAVLLALLLRPTVDQLQQGLLWEINDGRTTVGYLFGTMHSEDPRVVQIEEPVRQRFDSAAIFCAEVLLDIETRVNMSQAMFFSDGRQLSGKIDEHLFERTVALLGEYGIPAPLAGVMKPWAAAAVLSLPKPETGMFLDFALYAQAQEQGKSLCGLETVEETVALFDNTAWSLQQAMLRQAVEDYPSLATRYEEMIKVYLQRDLAQLEAFTEREMARSAAEVAEFYSAQLLEQRNRLMLERMLPQLRQGKAFIAVGAMHLPGEAGLLRLLEQQGYRVQAIY